MKRASHRAPPSSARALEQCTADEKGAPWLAGLAAVTAHGLLCALALSVARPAQSLAVSARSAPLYEVELPPPPPAPPEAEPEPPAPEPAPKLKLPKAVVEPPAPEPAPTEPEPPAPLAAQAAEAVTAAETADSPADTLITGEGAQFAGGTTERGGSATQAVEAASARALGVEGGTGSAPIDRSSVPQLASGLSWDCPFPEDAADEGVEEATVRMVVDIDPSGNVLGIEIQHDPGYGFARVARSCALRKRWLPARDRNGQPARDKLPVNVKFVAP